MYIAGVDVGKYENIGFYLTQNDNNIDSFEDFLKNLPKIMPLAIGFEAPLFVPGKCDKNMTRARPEIDHNRAWSCTSSFQCLFPILNSFFAHLKQISPPLSVYTSFAKFNESTDTNRVFIFESFISGTGGEGVSENLCSEKKSEHFADARLTSELFNRFNLHTKKETKPDSADFEGFVNLPKMFSALHGITCDTPTDGLILKSLKPVKYKEDWIFFCNGIEQLLLENGKVKKVSTT